MDLVDMAVGFGVHWNEMVQHREYDTCKVSFDNGNAPLGSI
jgi:hypothetical protein